jgi:NAD(P)-dependent dehydrogenase (short-subunit alcohol dehydrogenase family)
MRLKPLSKQVVVITGASSDVGLITARRAAGAGAKIFLIARNGEALAEIVQEIEANGGAAAFAAADVGNREPLQAAADKAAARYGWIDCWISNASVAIYAPLLETPLDEHERLFRTNYFGAVNGAQIALPFLAASGAALITVGSIAGDMPSPMMGAYTAFKHALAAFVRSLRIERKAARSPVSVTLISRAG